MALREFICPTCGVYERLFHTIAEDDAHPTDPCILCGKESKLVEISRTGSPILVTGIGGFHKPTA